MIAAPPSPLDLVELPFMRTALAELALLAVAGGLVGSWVVLRGRAFFAHATGTATFPGLVAADASGVSPTLGGLAVALGYAGGVERAGRAGRAPGEAATALVLVGCLGLGVVLASDVFESGGAVDRLLFGTLLALDGGDLALSAGAAALAAAATLVFGRWWTALAFDPEGAAGLALPVAGAELLLLLMIAVGVVAAIPAVGALLVTALFVVPAASALLLATSVPSLMAWAVGLAAAEGVVGLYVSLWADVPPGPAVALVGGVAFGLLSLATGR